jgi:hypothetical protein
LTIPFLAVMIQDRGSEIVVAEHDREGGVHTAGAPSIASRLDQPDRFRQTTRQRFAP